MLRHTSRAFDADLQELQHRILRMGALVEDAIAHAMRSLVDRDARRARETAERDHLIDRLELEVDEQCIELIALRQPTAGDLRLIITGLKITTDLERIGDLAVNLCERVLDLLEVPPLKPLVDLPRMGERARAMLRQALDAYVARDAGKAREVCALDDEVDRLNDRVYRDLLAHMTDKAADIPRALGLLMISKYLERIADHATNISEMVIYLVEGRDVRHSRAAENADPL